MGLEKGNLSKNSKSGETVVGSKMNKTSGFLNFLNITKEQMKRKHLICKEDSKIEESIIAKWESLDAKQKLKYELTIATRCSPKMFKDIICVLSKEKKEVIDELGFGVLSQLGCSILNRELCQMLVENFDPINMCFQIHEKTISIGPRDFERIMGVRDGGVTVDITGSMDEKKIKEMMKIYAQGMKSFKLRGTGFMDGCLLFMQLFYFDVISHGVTIVNKSLSPVVAWGDEEIQKLFKYVNENGGVHSTKMLVVKPHVDTKHHHKYSEIYEDEAATKADVIDLKANILSLGMRIDQMEPQMMKMINMQESVDRIEHSMLNFESKLLDSLVEKASKSLASKGEIPKERVMFPIEISSDGCLRKQQRKRDGPPWIHNISSDYVGDHNDVPVPQNESVHKKCKNTNKNNVHSICSSSPNVPQLFHCKSGPQRHLNFEYGGRFSGLVYERNIRSKIGPFAMHMKLTDEDYDIVRFLFPVYDIHEPEASQLVASTGSHVLTRREVKNCLAPKKYISNDVINYMADVFNESGSGRWYLPTYMADKAKFFMHRAAASPCHYTFPEKKNEPE